MSAAKRSSRRVKTQTLEELSEADALFLSIGEGAFMTDAQGRINRVNQVALDILGFDRKDLINQWYPGIVVAEDEFGNVINNIDRPITRVFLSGKSITHRLYYRRKDGTKVAVALNVSPVLSKGKPIGAIEVFRDITREISLEIAKDDFISVASHQLRTPATATKQYIAMILDGYSGKLTSRQINMLKRAYESNERQLRIIDDLLQVARLDAGRIELILEDIDLIELLQKVVREQSAKARARKQIMTLSASSKEISAKIDRSRMLMAFENLLDNALKYTPEGKQIQIDIRKIGGKAIVSIKDEGVGIGKGDIQKIFQKFSRVHNPLSIEAGGTGLGLYWVEKIVKLHRGKIEIHSSLNEGSVFSILLPLKAKNPTEKV